jgi:hypothetical protein
MDPALQHFLEAQTQLLQNLTTTVRNLQAQVNNPPVPPPAPRNKHREFMSHHPLVFTHAADPLEAEDWLKSILKSLLTLSYLGFALPQFFFLELTRIDRLP